VLTQVRISTPVLVARQTIARRESFSNLNCELKRVDITNYANKCYDSLSQLDGSRAMRTISAGMVIHERMIARTPAIERGEQVELSVSDGPVTVSIAGLARENGSVGDKIWIENQQSRQLVQALVIGKGRVKILNSRGAI
jgi:flagella basal body P-ring formation protein FlgA